MKKIAFLYILLILGAVALAAQQSETPAPSAPVLVHDTGDQIYSISASLLIPLFIYTPADIPAIVNDKMHLGGYFSLGWDAFLNRKATLGAEIGYSFSQAIDSRLYMSVPFLVRASYYLAQGDFNLPVSIGIGGVYNNFDDQHYFGLMVKPEVSGYWKLNDEWGLGLNAAYWFVPEIYFGTEADKTSYGNFISIVLLLTYEQE